MDPLVILSAEMVALATGETKEIGARVVNRGRRVESYRVDVIGDAAGIATVEPVTFSVLPGREQQVHVTFSAPDGADVRTGTLRFALRAASEVDPTASAIAEGTVELAGSGAVHAWFEETADAGRWSGDYRLHVENRGSAGVRLAITAHEPTGTLRLEAVPDAVDLVPGAPTTVQIAVKPRRPFLRGTPKAQTFQIATYDFPFGAPRPVPGTAPDPNDRFHHQFQLMFEQRAVLSKWMLVVAALAFVALVAFVVVRMQGRSEVELDVAPPYTPVEFSVTVLGSTQVGVAWMSVPNAVSYELWRTEQDGATLSDAEAIVTEDARTTVDDLAASMEVCFKVRSVGFDEQKSIFTDPACVTTDPEVAIAAPSDLAVVPAGPSMYTVSWSYPPEGLAAVESYEVIVDGQQVVSVVDLDTPAGTTSIEIGQIAEQRDVEVRVRAVTADGGRSAASEPIIVTIPALPVASPDAPAGGGETGEDGGSTTTVATVAPATTAPPPSSLELDPQREERWVAMLPDLGVAGTPPAQLRERLATATGRAVEEVRDFFNRDKLVTSSLSADYPADLLSGSATLTLPPSQRWVYVAFADDDAASVACATLSETGQPCVAAKLRSAGVPGSIVRELVRLPGNADVATIDDALEAARTQQPDRSVHVVAGADWMQFGTDEWIIVAVQRPEGDADLCPPGTCVTLSSAGE